MGREREHRRVRSRAERRRPSTRWNWPRAVGLAVILLLIGLIAVTMIPHPPTIEADPRPDQFRLGAPRELQSQSGDNFTDGALDVAVKQLFSSVDPSLTENQYFPQFAREKID